MPPTASTRKSPSTAEAVPAPDAVLSKAVVRAAQLLELTQKELAGILGVSEATIKAHVSAILQKLGVESRTQAVIAAAKIAGGQWKQGSPTA